MMFNSPTAFCTVRKDYVALDQTQRECAREHRCETDSKCPLAACFVHGASAEVQKVPEVAIAS